jgi:hypothetical protein
MIRYGRENTWDEYDTLPKISVSISQLLQFEQTTFSVP